MDKSPALYVGLWMMTWSQISLNHK